MTEKEELSITVLLDKSGSMKDMDNEPVDGLNNFFEKQNSTGTYKTTLAFFNENIEYVCKNVESVMIKPLTYEDYNPKGMTALYDSLADLILYQKELKTKKVIFLIITDGRDNSSQKYNKQSIKKMITEMENGHNWQFIYLGANQDAFEVGNSIGIRKSGGYEYTKEGCKNLMECVSNSISKCVSNEIPIDKLDINAYLGKTTVIKGL